MHRSQMKKIKISLAEFGFGRNYSKKVYTPENYSHHQAEKQSEPFKDSQEGPDEHFIIKMKVFNKEVKKTLDNVYLQDSMKGCFHEH